MYGILLQNISTGLGLLLDDFPNNNKIWVRPGPTPPTHFHSQLEFLHFVYYYHDQ